MRLNHFTTCAIVSAALGMGWTLPTMANPGEQITRFTGKVDAPDVMGGYASTHVIVRVKPGVHAVTLNDRRQTFALNVHDEKNDIAALQPEAITLAETLERWAVADIRPTLPFQPADPALAAQHGLDRYFTLQVPEATDTREMTRVLETFQGTIERAELDGIGGILQTIPNDPSFNQQYGLHNTGQTIGGEPGVPGADISAVDAWDIHTGTDDIIVAIVDTGITTGHPDLSGTLVTGYNSIDGSGNVNDSWIVPHGTHVAGIAAADTNNGVGMAGVSWGALIMPVKVLNDWGGGNETDIANGCIWAADNGAHVINMSLGVPSGITFFENAVNYAHDSGVLVIAASGNTPGAPIPPPAKWDNVMAVGSTDNRDDLSKFTTTGPEMSVTAPGTDVYSTWVTWLGESTYTLQSGTSMAAPHVAGLAALIWSADLELTNENIWQIIEDTADDLGTPGWNPQFGHGRINAYSAINAVVKPQCHAADINCDDVVNVDDLLMLLNNWG